MFLKMKVCLLLMFHCCQCPIIRHILCTSIFRPYGSYEMAKAPGKSDDSIRNKLKNLFGIKGAKSGSDQLGQPKQHQTEFVFTAEIIKVPVM